MACGTNTTVPAVLMNASKWPHGTDIAVPFVLTDVSTQYLTHNHTVQAMWMCQHRSWHTVTLFKLVNTGPDSTHTFRARSVLSLTLATNWLKFLWWVVSCWSFMSNPGGTIENYLCTQMLHIFLIHDQKQCNNAYYFECIVCCKCMYAGQLENAWSTYVISMVFIISMLMNQVKHSHNNTVYPVIAICDVVLWYYLFVRWWGPTVHSCSSINHTIIPP